MDNLALGDILNFWNVSLVNVHMKVHMGLNLIENVLQSVKVGQ